MGLLALAELRRAPLRSGLLATAVALLVFLIVFQQGLLTGLVGGLIGGLRSGDGDVVVLSEQASGAVQGSIITADQAEEIAQVDGVDAVGEVGIAALAVQTEAGASEVTLVGYQLDQPGGPSTLTDGRMPESDGEAVVGRAGDEEGYELGAQIEFDDDGGTVEIVGVVSDATFNALPTLYTSFDTFADARLAENPDLRDVLPSILAVDAADGVTATELAQAITAAVDDVEALQRQAAADNAPGIDSIQQSFQLIFALVFIVTTLVVSLSFLIVTAQKVPSFALLRALGRPASELIGALLLQVVIIVGLGGAIGAAGGLAMSTAIDVGFDAGAAPLQALAATGGVLALSVIGSLAAARRIATIDPLSATTTQGLGT